MSRKPLPPDIARFEIVDDYIVDVYELDDKGGIKVTKRNLTAEINSTHLTYIQTLRHQLEQARLGLKE